MPPQIRIEVADLLPSVSVGRMKVVEEDGQTRIAEFNVETIDESLTLVLESAGGATKSGNARNQDYVAALRLILERLRDLGAEILDAVVDSRVTRDIPIANRRLHLRGRGYPVVLTDERNLEDLRLAITTAEGRIGQGEGVQGGDKRKRIRLTLDVPLPDLREPVSLCHALATPSLASTRSEGGARSAGASSAFAATTN